MSAAYAASLSLVAVSVATGSIDSAVVDVSDRVGCRGRFATGSPCGGSRPVVAVIPEQGIGVAAEEFLAIQGPVAIGIGDGRIRLVEVELVPIGHMSASVSAVVGSSPASGSNASA